MIVFRSLTRRLIFISILLFLIFGIFFAGSFRFTSHINSEIKREEIFLEMEDHYFRLMIMFDRLFDERYADSRAQVGELIRSQTVDFELLIMAVREGDKSTGLEPLEEPEMVRTLDRLENVWRVSAKPKVEAVISGTAGSEELGGMQALITERTVPDEIRTLHNLSERHLISQISWYSRMRLFALIFSVTLSIFVIIYFRQSIVLPLRGIIRTMREFEGGNFDVRVEDHGIDEVRELAHGFNDTAARLKDAFQELRRQTLSVLRLSESSSALTGIGSSLKLFQEICDHAVRIFGAEFVWLGMMEGAKSGIVPKARAGSGAGSLPEEELRCSNTPSLLAMVTCTPRVFSVDDRDPAYACWRDAVAAQSLRTLLSVPIIGADGMAYGVINFYSSRDDRFSADTVDRALIFSNLAAAALEKVQVLEALEETVASRTKELEDARLLAVSANKAKSFFLANMSHDLRTPLNAIIGFSDALASGIYGELAPKHKEYLTDILKAGYRLLDMVNEILDLSRLETGSIELDAVEMMVSDTVNSAVYLFREKAKKHAITLGTALSSDSSMITADQNKLKQAIVSILTHRFVTIPEGSSMDITLRRLEEADAALPAVDRIMAEAGGGYLIRIEDNGPSIPRAAAEKLFEPHEHLEQSLERTGAASLGLGLAKRFIELHGGTIWYEQGHGQEQEAGNRFMIVLPLRPIHDTLKVTKRIDGGEA